MGSRASMYKQKLKSWTFTALWCFSLSLQLTLALLGNFSSAHKNLGHTWSVPGDLKLEIRDLEFSLLSGQLGGLI